MHTNPLTTAARALADLHEADAPPRFVVIRSPGSQFNVFDTRRDAVALDGRRFNRDVAQRMADDLNDVIRPLPPVASALPMLAEIRA